MRSIERFTLAVPLLVSALAACSTGAPPPDTTPPLPTATPEAVAPQAPGTEVPTAAAAPGIPPAASVVGKWSSPSCGPRTYERRLSLDRDGSFSAEDRVSPCPPGAACVWSGIVFRRGTYAVANGSIQLTAATNAAGPGKPLPLTLAIDPSTGAPVEELPEGERCVYRRAR